MLHADLRLCPAESYLLHAGLRLCPAESYLLHEDLRLCPADLCPTESYLLPAESYLLPAELYLLPAEFKSDHTSNSVKALFSFHQVSHQQEYSFHNRYIFATLSSKDVSIRVGNYLRSSLRLGECGFAKVVSIVDYVSPYSYDDSMCVL